MVISGAGFSIERNLARQLPNHYLLRSKKREAGGLTSPALIRELKDNVIPAFRLALGQEFRLVADTPQAWMTPEINLLSGEGISQVNPQDWRTPRKQFSRRCSPVTNGHTLYRNEKVIGVGAMDPKSAVHFFVLSLRQLNSLAEAEVELWIDFFKGAEQILATLNGRAQYIRYTIGVGVGYQNFPGAYLEVQGSTNSLPSFFPQDYGFSVNKEGVIEAPEGSRPHQELITTIDNRRSSENCSCREATGSLDEAILRGLARLL
ncbi:MAG: hypothetical protein WC645_00090 [Candidatus Margulisiibacteriota bacterium]